MVMLVIANEVQQSSGICRIAWKLRFLLAGQHQHFQNHAVINGCSVSTKTLFMSS